MSNVSTLTNLLQLCFFDRLRNNFLGKELCLLLFFLLFLLLNLFGFLLLFLIIFFWRHIFIIKIELLNTKQIFYLNFFKGHIFSNDHIIKYQNILHKYKNTDNINVHHHHKISFFHMLSQDQIRLVSGLLILIPLSLFIRFIKPTPYRYVYSLILGFILQIFVFSYHMIGLYCQSIIVFAMIKLLKGRRIGSIVTIQSMLFLSAYQIKQIIYNYGGWTMDATALLMIFVCKYSLLAFAIQDGVTSEQKLTEEQRKFRVTSDISFYDFLGYLNFLPTSILGPPLQYVEYRKFMEQQPPFDNIPDTIRQTFKVLGHGVLCVSIYLIGEFTFPIAYMRTDEFYQNNSLYVLFYSFISMTLIRFKYYFGWKISIAAVHASGASYDGQKFSLINTCSPLVVETDKHIRNKLSHWNIAVQQWLRKAIYNRSPFKSKGVSQLWVFMVSAFWHGFYAGYYFSFFLWFVQVYAQGQIFKFVKVETSKLRKFYKNLGWLGNIGLSLMANFIFSHNASFFILLDNQKCFRLLEKVNYVPQTILITLAVTFTLLNMMHSKKSKGYEGGSKKSAVKPSTDKQQKTE